MIRAVAFDLDGVVRRWRPAWTRSIERRHGLPSGSINRVAFEPALLERAVTGEIPDEAWRAAVARDLEAQHGVQAHGAVGEWARLRGEIDPDVLDVVRDVRREVPVALLTNATTRLAEDLDALGLAGEFDVIANSAERHLSKPDPEVFRWAAGLLGVGPAACALVDDEPGNVAAAAAVGMVAIRHRGAGMTRRRLAAVLGAGTGLQHPPAGGSAR